MKIKELIAAAPFCDAVEIVVREHGSGKWIQGYRISKYAEQWKSEHTVELEGKIKIAYGGKVPELTAGEIRDVMRGYNMPMKIIKKNIDKLPESVMNLEVCSFQPRHIPSFHREQLTHNEFSLDIDAYPEGFIPEVEEKKQSTKDLEGQMNIMEFLEVE